MRGGSVWLAAVQAAVLGLVYLVTRVFSDPPLAVGTTMLIGGTLTVLLTLGYPSALRGPRGSRTSRLPLLRRVLPAGGQSSASAGAVNGSGPGSRPNPRSSARSTRTLAAVGRPMPLRSGLTEDAAVRTAKLLRPLLGGDAVAITDKEQVLAFIGPGEGHHKVGDPPQTDATVRVLASGRTIVVRQRSKLSCPEAECPLQSAVVAPLAIGKRIVGTLKVYRVYPDPPARDLVEGMAGILSLHLELAELDRERNLAADAKLDALRAQINPHFLFNVLNTIASKARTDPESARQLLLRLSDFFRYAVRQDGQLAEFGQEYFFVRTYLALEQARYGERVRVKYDIDPQVLTAHVPVLTIQPLIENAVKHGLADKMEGGTITLKARVDPLTRTTAIQVADDGLGIPPAVLDKIMCGEPGGNGGVGLRNISQRLETLFGERYRLDVQSTEGTGTVVDLHIPLR